MRIAISLVALLIVCGCAPKPPLPVYAWKNSADALAVLRERAAGVRTVQGECAIDLTRADGQRVQLDGALVIKPGHVRLRAWKMGRAIFDLTLTPSGLYVWTPPEPAQRAKIMPAAISAEALTRGWSFVSGEFFQTDDLVIVDEGGATFKARRAGQTPGTTLAATVDRATLTPVRYALQDENGGERFSLRLHDYRRINGVLWPMHLLAVADDGAKAAVTLRNVELNEPLATGAFDPPPRAERRP